MYTLEHNCDKQLTILCLLSLHFVRLLNKLLVTFIIRICFLYIKARIPHVLLYNQLFLGTWNFQPILKWLHSTILNNFLKNHISCLCFIIRYCYYISIHMYKRNSITLSSDPSCNKMEDDETKSFSLEYLWDTLLWLVNPPRLITLQ